MTNNTVWRCTVCGVEFPPQTAGSLTYNFWSRNEEGNISRGELHFCPAHAWPRAERNILYYDGEQWQEVLPRGK